MPAPKPIDFDSYMHWFNAHKLVVQAQSAPVVHPQPTKAALIPAATGDPKQQPIAHPEPEEGFEPVFEYFVSDASVVMVTCGGEVVGPAVSMDWEREVQDEVVEEEWEEMQDEEEEGWVEV